MNDLIPLSSLVEGERCRVEKLLLDGKMRSRLRDLGLIEGSCVECLQRSSSGDITAFLICGAVIALRRDTSSEVLGAPASDTYSS